MIQETIRCPKCGEVVKLSEAITHDIETAIKNKYEKRWNHVLMKNESNMK